MIPGLDQLLAGELSHCLVGPASIPSASVLLAGSFNPLHRGHERLLRAAELTAERNGLFELSVVNVDKPPLDAAEVRRRVERLRPHGVVLTRSPTFISKAEVLPGTWFAMGFDTAIRLVSTKYHADVPGMLSRFRDLGTRFVVAGRLQEAGFQGLESVDVPAGFEALFIPVPESLFREDISSTQLRGK